ncbi:MAG TPA: hypothetical protein VGG86_12075, partial [Roseiarcus sp.]
YEALAKRHPQSRTRGRRGAAAEVVLRLLVLKHMRNWSYGVLEREVRDGCWRSATWGRFRVSIQKWDQRFESAFLQRRVRCELRAGWSSP